MVGMPNDLSRRMASEALGDRKGRRRWLGTPDYTVYRIDEGRFSAHTSQPHSNFRAARFCQFLYCGPTLRVNNHIHWRSTCFNFATYSAFELMCDFTDVPPTYRALSCGCHF